MHGTSVWFLITELQTVNGAFLVCCVVLQGGNLALEHAKLKARLEILQNNHRYYECYGRIDRQG